MVRFLRLRSGQVHSPQALKFLNQKGIAPLIVIIITFLIVGGTAVVVQREAKKQKSNTTSSQTSKSQTAKETKNQNKDAKTAQSTAELSQDSFVSEPKQAGVAEPGFSFNPPSGWVKVDVSGNNKVAFEAPSEDRVTIDIDDPKVQDLWLWSKAMVNIHIEKTKTADLNTEISNEKEDFAKEGISLDKWEQAKLSGEDGFYFEGAEKLEGTKAVEQIKAQLKAEAEEKIGKGALSKEIESKIDKLISDFVRRYTGYILYKNGYSIIISGNALRSFWNKREPQLTASLNTFKILAASEDSLSEEKALKDFPEYSKAKNGNFVSAGTDVLPKFALTIPSGWMQKIIEDKSYYRLELRPASQYNQSWVLVTISKSVGGIVTDLPKRAESKRDEKITKNGYEGKAIEYTEDKFSNAPKHVLTDSFIVDAYLMEISSYVPEKDWEKLSDQIKNIFDSFRILTSVNK